MPVETEVHTVPHFKATINDKMVPGRLEHTGSFSLAFIHFTTDALVVTILVSNEAKCFKEFKYIDLVR